MSSRHLWVASMILAALLAPTFAPSPLFAPLGRVLALEARPEAQQAQAVKTVRITAERFSFTPSRIQVKKGTIVEIVAESEDTSHGFHLPAAGIESMITGEAQPSLYPLNMGEMGQRNIFVIESEVKEAARIITEQHQGGLGSSE